MLARETAEAEQELRALLPELGPAFDLMSDVSAAEPLDTEAEAAVSQLAQLLVPAGLCTSVRVVGRSGRTALQFERISRTAGYEARLVTASPQPCSRVVDTGDDTISPTWCLFGTCGKVPRGSDLPWTVC